MRTYPIVTVQRNVKKVMAVHTDMAKANTAFIRARIPFILKKKTHKMTDKRFEELCEVKLECKMCLTVG